MQNINPERGRLWTQALLSGEYQQARGQFVDVRDGKIVAHCCLAVATDIAIKNGCKDVRWHTENSAVLIRWNENKHGSYDDYDNTRLADGSIWIDSTDGDLPEPVADWLGIISEGSSADGTRSPKCNPALDGTLAVSRNDDNHDTFQTIANAIERDIARVEARS
jgi:hypothetical protein